MIVEYEGTEYDLDLDETTVQQAKTVKNSTGLTLKGLEDGLAEGDADALRALFWLMQENSGVHTDINTVDFKIVKFSKAVQAAAEKEREEKEAAEKAAAAQNIAGRRRPKTTTTTE